MTTPLTAKSNKSPSYIHASAKLKTFHFVRHHVRLRRLQQWIADHGALPLTHQRAARIAGLEPHHFSTVFHSHVGVTFAQWMHDYKISWAIQALESGQFSIEQVAHLAGYRGRRSLERSVKRKTGKTPAQLIQKSA
jgi:two-component system response regulator YesN